jgi:hypothetical protein
MWLASSVFFLAILVVQYENLRPANYAILIGGIFVSAFMFSFRRKLRLKKEKAHENEINRLEKELEEDTFQDDNPLNPTRP